MFLITTLLKILSLLPFGILYLISDFLVLIMRMVGYRKKVIDENLKKSFPSKSKQELTLLRNLFYKNLADVLVETLKSITITEKQIRKRVQFSNPKLATDNIKSNQAFITLASHQCNWEWQLLASSLLGFEIDAAYKEVRNKPINKLLLDMRSKFGANLIESKLFLRNAVKRKDVPRGIAMVGDQRPGKNADFRTTMLNQDTAMFTGAEKLAKAFNYPVLFMEMQREKRGHYKITLYKLAEPPYEKKGLPANQEGFQITQKYAEMMEKAIQKHPADWLWSHKRWRY